VCIIVAQQQRIRKKEISCQVRGNWFLFSLEEREKCISAIGWHIKRSDFAERGTATILCEFFLFQFVGSIVNYATSF
jgi:hypothetical protein